MHTHEQDPFFLCLIRFLVIKVVCTFLAHRGYRHSESSIMIEAILQIFMVCASAINKSCCPRPANYETDTSPTLCLCNGQIRRRLWSRVLNFVWDPSLGLHGSLQRKNQGFGDSLELRPMRFLSGPFDIAIVSCSSGTRPPISWTTERTGPATSFARLSLPLNQGLIHA